MSDHDKGNTRTGISSDDINREQNALYATADACDQILERVKAIYQAADATTLRDKALLALAEALENAISDYRPADAEWQAAIQAQKAK